MWHMFCLRYALKSLFCTYSLEVCIFDCNCIWNTNRFTRMQCDKGCIPQTMKACHLHCTHSAKCQSARYYVCSHAQTWICRISMHLWKGEYCTSNIFTYSKSWKSLWILATLHSFQDFLNTSQVAGFQATDTACPNPQSVWFFRRWASLEQESLSPLCLCCSYCK